MAPPSHNKPARNFGRARRAWLFTLLAAVAGTARALQPDDLLDPREAFRLSATPLDAGNVAVTFRIADGYYMYRERFRFESANGQLLADVELPAGERKKDAFFGETETYRRQVTLRVPVSAADAARGHVQLKITSQGCADAGVCFLPVVQTVEVELPDSRVFRARDQLATTGLYRIVRHPQYLGLILIVLAFNIQWPTLLTLVMAPLLIVMYVRQARREDAGLAIRFGDEFVHYAARVPAFIPRRHRAHWARQAEKS